MATAGYSGTPLAKKLGIKPGFRLRLVNPPGYYFSLFDDLPVDITVVTERIPGQDIIHYFTTLAKDLKKDMPSFKNEIVPDGMIWVSWPKKASKVITDITEGLVRELALANGLVDIKVCAVDDTWSGLKLVIPVKDRPVIVKLEKLG